MSAHKPWMKLWKKAWQSDEGLAMCSPGAHGLLLNLLMQMDDSDEPGVLLVRGKPPTNAYMARLFRWDVSLVETLIGELLENSVLSQRDDDGALFSRRMVRDAEISEVGRTNIERRWGAKGEGVNKTDVDPNSGAKSRPSTKRKEVRGKIKTPPTPSRGGAAKPRNSKNQKQAKPKQRAVAETAKRRVIRMALPFEARTEERTLALGDLKMTEAEFEQSQAGFVEWATQNGRRTAGEPDWNLALANWLRRDAKGWGAIYRKSAPSFTAKASRDTVKLPDGPPLWRKIAEGLCADNAALFASWWSPCVAEENLTGIVLTPINTVARDWLRQNLHTAQAYTSREIIIAEPKRKASA